MTLPASSSDWRARLGTIVEAPRAQTLIITLIIINAAILGLETSPAVMASWGGLLLPLDQAILAVFVIELALRIAAHGWRFFRDPWSVFDFIVVVIALLPASGPFAVLRALRVLRVLRLLTMVPNMRRVVGGLLAAIPGLASVFGIISIIFYVAAVIATKLFGGHFPDWFGTLGSSAYTLFQVMTLESWSMGIVRPVMEVFPQAWIFFVLFILISTFTMLNLFIAVIVNAIQAEHDIEIRDKEAGDAPPPEVQLREEVRAMRNELQELRRLLEQQAAR
ncbi:MAG: ion transporter [Burkholderiales bacterium]|nr:ion transporter [Burkholderiales bacterium]